MTLRGIGLLVVAIPAWACSCGSWPTAREAWDDSRLVFVGRFEQSKVVRIASDGRGGLRQVASLRVEKAFKGVKAGELVTLHEELGTSCSANFRDGDTWLFYLHPAREPNAWVAPACHRSKALTRAADDLLFLRALPDSLKRSRLSGEVELYEHSVKEGFRRERSLAGIRVRITGDSDSTDVVTNSDGVYEVYGLPAGAYKVEVQAPPMTKLSFAVPFGRQNPARGANEILLPPDGSAGVDFVVMQDNRISGRVLGPDGNPLKNVCVDLKPAWTAAGPYFHISGCTKESGEFTLEMMPPGQYRLVLNASGRPTASSPFPALYYPGTPDTDKAIIVTIGEGEHVANLDIRVPALSRRIRLSGRMQFSDGAPISNQSVTFVSVNERYREYARTAADGSFALTLVAGVPGEVRGEMLVDRESAVRCPEFGAKLNPGGWVAILSPPPISVDGTQDSSGLVLAFPFPSCNHRKP